MIICSREAPQKIQSQAHKQKGDVQNILDFKKILHTALLNTGNYRIFRPLVQWKVKKISKRQKTLFGGDTMNLKMLKLVQHDATLSKSA